jgi:protein SCO1/2
MGTGGRPSGGPRKVAGRVPLRATGSGCPHGGHTRAHTGSHTRVARVTAPVPAAAVPRLAATPAVLVAPPVRAYVEGRNTAARAATRTKSQGNSMSGRLPRLLIVFAAFLAGLGVCLGGILYFTRAGTGPINIPTAAIGAPFRLVDQNGAPFSDQNLKGKPFLVFFGFTHCPDVCPTALFEMSEIMRKLGSDADRTAALFVTVDPERDTPASMKDYLASFDPHIRGLTGDSAALAAVAKAYRVYYKKVPLDGGDYTMDHTAIVYLMDKDGRFISPFNMKRTADVAAADLKKYL